MNTGNGWTRNQLLIAFKLYCQLPFGKMHSRNTVILDYAKKIGRTPSALAMKLTNIASLDPAITSTGRRGLTGASAADRAMWDEMQNNWETFSEEISSAEIRLGISGSHTDNETGEDDDGNYSGGTKDAIVRIRIGQQFFRKAVLSSYDFKCCVSGLSIRHLLVASHIIPWKDNEHCRLNPKNGLCLSSLHDKAFDKGIITLTEKYTVKVSDKYKERTDSFFVDSILKYEGKQISFPGKFFPSQDFLAYHREHIFIGGN